MWRDVFCMCDVCGRRGLLKTTNYNLVAGDLIPSDMPKRNFGKCCNNQMMITKTSVSTHGILVPCARQHTLRKPPLWMSINRYNKLCWCGSPRSGNSRYCKDSHEFLWKTEFCVRWDKLRQLVLRRDKHVCQCCGTDKKLTIDHIEAKCLGGAWGDAINLQSLCFRCHKMKTKQDQAHLILVRTGWRNPKVFKR